MFDLYALSSNEGKGSIRAVLNYDAEKIVSEIKAKTTQAEFCRNLGITYMTFWDYLNRSSSIPLFVLQEYEKLTGKSLQKYIKNLECGIGDSKRRTTAVKSLSEDLTKIIGAFIADGHMKERSSQWNNRNATHYEIVFREEHKTNAQALSSWIYNIFNMKINPVKQDNTTSFTSATKSYLDTSGAFSGSHLEEKRKQSTYPT